MAPDPPESRVRGHFEVYDTQRPEAVMAFVHPDPIYPPPGGDESLDRRGRQADEAPFFAAFTDIESIVEGPIAEGERVATRATVRCTHTGACGGVPPTGWRIAISFTDIPGSTTA